MTDYNGEQNNIIGTEQPTDAQPIVPTEPQAAAASVEPQIAVSEAPVSETPADIQVAVSEAPAQIQPASPVYQAPVQIQPTAPAPQKKSKAPIFIGIGIFLVGVIIALVLVFVLVGNNDEDDKSKDNKTETEQTEDKPSSEDDNNRDEDNKDANGDKDNTDKDNSDKDNSDKDNSSGDDKTDKGDEDEKVDDDTPADAVVDAEYTEFLDAFCDVCCGDVSRFERLLPEALWNLMRVGLSEDFGHVPTKEEIMEMLESEADGAEFADEATYVVLEESVADDEAIGYMQETLQEVLILDEIEEAYEIRILWTIEADGKTLEYEEVAYAVYFDGEWTLMSKNYIPYIMDAEDFGQAFEDTFGENFI